MSGRSRLTPVRPARRVSLKQTKTMRTVGVAALCAALGTPGVSPQAAASGTSKKGREIRLGRRPGGHAVHEDAVVLNKASELVRHAEDSASVVSVSGDQLTIKEGAAAVTSKTLTLTIPRARERGASATAPRPAERAEGR